MAPAPAYGSPYLFARGRVFNFLFQEFKVESGATLILCMMISFVLATSTTLLSESFLRNPHRAGFKKVGAFVLRFFLHYVTTMLVLTMNIPIFLAILLGHAFGYLLSFIFFPSPLNYSKNASPSTPFGSVEDHAHDRDFRSRESTTLDYLLAHGFSGKRNSTRGVSGTTYGGPSGASGGPASAGPLLPVAPPAIAEVPEVVSVPPPEEEAPAVVRDCLRPHGLAKGGVGMRLEDLKKKSALCRKKTHLLNKPRRSISAQNFGPDHLGPALADLRHVDSTDFAIPSFSKD